MDWFTGRDRFTINKKYHARILTVLFPTVNNELRNKTNFKDLKCTLQNNYQSSNFVIKRIESDCFLFE